ncbi:MAG TPA: hypothetical protein VKA09_16230 [Nitrososphaeraceae archaeon]|jgi:hypothetical protein|nr:hypothetical protein [Nitrososphaeraceae archaeon]
MEKTTTTTITASASSAAKWDRKVSVAISMPQGLIEKIDIVRGDIPRSIFVCKILHTQIRSKKGEEE